MTIGASGDTSVSGDVLPAPEGTLASVTLKRQGSGFPRLTADFTIQLSSFSLPHLILLHSLFCGIFQPSTTSFPPTSHFLSSIVIASLLNAKLLSLLYPSISSWCHGQVFAEATNQTTSSWETYLHPFLPHAPATSISWL